MSGRPRLVRKGLWGGEHIGLQVENKGVRLEYDCAHGTIDKTLRLDRKGRFSVNGTHTREHGGPTLEGEQPDNHPALYTGQVKGRRMVITIHLTDTKQTLGPFTLTYGKTPMLTKCL
ncbi:MAG: hypothetical protein ICV60_18535 [Pyrinomonadaceae bacterium]|nr:hypothetical protein [Pyrinomonadaceae bacterium]